jgi:hypothetical protein
MFVKIYSDRGYGDQVWKVISENKTTREVTLQNKDKEKVVIYKEHTYGATVEEIRAVFGWPPKDEEGNPL